MTTSVIGLSIDCADPVALAGFWSEVLGRPVNPGADAENAAIDATDPASGPRRSDGPPSPTPKATSSTWWQPSPRVVGSTVVAGSAVGLVDGLRARRGSARARRQEGMSGWGQPAGLAARADQQDADSGRGQDGE
jgi:hypothetical protein